LSVIRRGRRRPHVVAAAAKDDSDAVMAMERGC